jgi:putative membrane protein
VSDPAPGFARLHPLTPLLRGWAFLVAGAVAVGQQLLGDIDPVTLALTALAVLALGVLVGAASWWFTRFRIAEDELRIESGVFRRRSRRIPIERLQAVDVVQPLAARLFGLAELRLEVAGGSRTEAPLSYLPLGEAHRVRAALLGQVSGARPPVEGSAAPPPPGHRLILSVPPGQLLAGVLLSTQFLFPLLSALVFAGFLVASAQPVGVALLLPWLAGVGSVVAKDFVAQYGFTLSESADGLRIRRGLLDVRTQTVPPGRVQGIAIVEPLLWRPLHWVRLQIDVAGYVGTGDHSTAKSLSTLLPVSRASLADAVVTRVLPGVAVRTVPLAPAPPAARWLRPVGWRYLAVGVDDSVLVTREGWLVRRTSIVPHAKTQSVRLRQGPCQRRLGLADVHVDSPPGPVRAIGRHRLPADARALALDQLVRARAARRATPG